MVFRDEATGIERSRLAHTRFSLPFALVLAFMQLGGLDKGGNAMPWPGTKSPAAFQEDQSDSRDDEHYGLVIVRDRGDLRILTRLASIANVRGDTVFVFANGNQWQALHRVGFHPVELPAPGRLDEHAMSMSPARNGAWDTYPTYAGYLSMMNAYAATFPTLCILDTIGLSVQGRLILVVKISGAARQHGDRPQLLYTSTMHGNETVGYVLLLRLIDYLLTQYGQNTPEGTRVTRLVENAEIWINPLFNPDGTYRLGGDTTVSKARRTNAHGVDLNRNFPDRVNNPVNTGMGREPETQAMMRFVAAHNFSLSANFHGGAQVVNYPWDNGQPSGSYSACPDDAWFVHLARTYATPNPDIMSGGFPNGITNGCEWYDIFGGRQDWIYYWHGGRETTIELTNAYNPSGTVLPQRWENNKESLLAYLEESLKGIRGIIVEAGSRKPVRARIDIAQIPNVPVFSDSSAGDYHRLVLPGVYDFIVSADGYLSDTVRNVTVLDSGATRIDVTLERVTLGVSERPLAIPSFGLEQNYPNPFNPTTGIRFQVSGVSDVRLTVYDILGREVAVLVNEKKMPGKHEVEFDGSGLPTGIYFCRLRAGNFEATRKLVLLK